MPVHPVAPEPLLPPEDDTAAPNPSHLPVEPEFAPVLPPAEPEGPGAKPPPI
jgi:hypothetical protein